MTYSAAQQHLLQRLGITPLHLSLQKNDVDVVHPASSNTSEPSSAALLTPVDTLDWQLLPESQFSSDLQRALTHLALLSDEVVQLWSHAECAAPCWFERQLYLRLPEDGAAKRELWRYLCQQEPSS